MPAAPASLPGAQRFLFAGQGRRDEGRAAPNLADGAGEHHGLTELHQRRLEAARHVSDHNPCHAAPFAFSTIDCHNSRRFAFSTRIVVPPLRATAANRTAAEHVFAPLSA